MANLWETLNEQQRSKVVQAYISQQGGRKDNQNSNRAREQLVNNPEIVQRIAKEEGLIDETEDQVQEGEDQESRSIEDNVAASLEEPEGDVQATGQNSRAAIPPAETGESMEDYIRRLSSVAASGGRQFTENDNAGDRNRLSEEEKEIAQSALSGTVASDLSNIPLARRRGFNSSRRSNDN